MEFAAANNERVRQRSGDCYTYSHGTFGGADTAHENAEFIASEPGRNGVFIDQRFIEARFHLPQHIVAGPMAEGVVDIFELIQIEQQKGCHST